LPPKKDVAPRKISWNFYAEDDGSKIEHVSVFANAPGGTLIMHETSHARISASS